jgi:HAE1 family hydrophobic/amphiphilic exporter-1
MSLAKSVVRRPVLWLVVFALVSISGVFLFSNIAVDMLPEIEPPWLLVSTAYPGADPQTVEKSVTNVLEAALANTSGLILMESESREQISLIMLEFEFGADINEKIIRLRENLDMAEDALPEDARSPQVLLRKTNDEPIMRIAVKGERPQNELRALAVEEIQNRLTRIEGVASCSVEGGQDAIVLAALSQNRLESYGLTINEIARALGRQNLQLGAGALEDGRVEYSVKTAGEYTSLAEIADTVVARPGGADIRLTDIGEVRFDFAEETSSVYINGEPGVYLAIMKQSGANTVSMADEVYRRIDSIGKTLPRDVRLEVIEDSSLAIRDMIAELINSAVLGIVLAVLVLFLFFRSLNSSLIAGLSIPISFLITLLAMTLAGVTINMMTLAGLILGLGMIVDSSIVVLEGITKFREKGEQPAAAAILAGEEVMASIIASTLTTLCVFVPIFLFKNQLEIIGILVQDMIFTIAVSVASSLLVGIFLVPVLASKWLPVHSRLQKPVKNRLLAGTDRAIASMLEGLNRGYTRLLGKALRHRLIAVLLVVSAFAGSLLGLTRLDLRMLPETEGDMVTVNLEMPLGTRYNDTKAVILALQDYALAELAGVKNIIAGVGGQESPQNNTGMVQIILDLKDCGADTVDQVKDKLRAHFPLFPGAVFTFSEGGIGEELEDGPAIDLVIDAEDLEQGIANAEAIKTLLETQAGETGDAAIDVNPGLPELRIVVDRRRAYNMGLDVASIAGEIAAAINGVTATAYRDADHEYDVVLQLAGEDRDEIPDLGRIFVRSSGGTLYPALNFADFEKAGGPVTINHEGQARVIHITAELREGENLQAAQAKIRALLDGAGLEARFAGELEDMGGMMQAAVLALVMALLLVFGVMAAQYESFRDPFINFCTIPLILIGVVLAHILSGQSMSMFTMIGFVMLAGIVVNNGILLVDYTNGLVRQGASVMDACLEAGGSRFRPVLMTALTTMLGLAPMAFFPGKSSMMTAPIGLAVFGGLASATCITLFFIPVLYSLVNSKKEGTKT